MPQANQISLGLATTIAVEVESWVQVVARKGVWLASGSQGKVGLPEEGF